MTRKVFQLSIELDLHAITCPGVWLCPNNGKVSLCIYMFETWRETSLIYPVFPLLIHEKFKFTKDISNAKSLSDIQNSLNSEHLYCELVQWSEVHRSRGIILANFKTCLANLLYPTDNNQQLVTGIDTELLMNPCPPFPGIIAPKIEIATRTTIKETMSKCTNKCPTYILNPKVIRSAHCERREKFRRQRGVCHSNRSVPNENRLRPSSLSRLDSYRTKRQHPIDSYDTKYEQNIKPRNVNSIFDNNNNNSILTSPCECCKSRQASPIRQCKTQSAPKCFCDALVHNNCSVCDKYQHYFNEVTTHMALGQDENSPDDEYCRISSPCISQYQHHARRLHDRVSNALNRSKQIESKSTYDLHKTYDPNEYTVRKYRSKESKPIHSSKYCDKDSIINEYDQTYSDYHKSRPFTASSTIEKKKLCSNNIPRTKSEDSSRRECTHRKSQKCEEKILNRRNKQKADTKFDTYRQATFSSVYTTNKPKVRSKNHLEMYKSKHKTPSRARKSNVKNNTSFRSIKVAVQKPSIHVLKKFTKKKRNTTKNYQKQSKISVEGDGSIVKTSNQVKTPKYSVVKTVKKCKKNVNKNIPSELNNCVDHLVIIERQSVVQLIEEKIKAGEIKFNNSKNKSLNTNKSLSISSPKRDFPSKCNIKWNKSSTKSEAKSNISQQTINKKKQHPSQMKHPFFQRVIINTVKTELPRSVEKSVTKSENVENEEFKSEIIKPSMGELMNVSLLTNQQPETRSESETIKHKLMETLKKPINKTQCDDKTCPYKVSVNSMDGNEPKPDIENIKATIDKIVNRCSLKMENLETKTHKLLETLSKPESKSECHDKTCKNKVSVDSIVDDLMDLFKKCECDVKSENTESDEPKSEIEMIKITMEKIVKETLTNSFNKQPQEIERKSAKQESDETISELERINAFMGNVINDSSTIDNLMDLIQGKTLSKEFELIKHESDLTESEFGFIESTLYKTINEIFAKKKHQQSTSTNTDENNAESDQKSQNNLDDYNKSNSITSLINNVPQIPRNLSEEKSKKDLNEYIKNSSSDEKSDDDIDEYIQNSSIASLVNNISQMIKKLDNENGNNLDEYIKNSSIASIVKNINTQLAQKCKKTDKHFTEHIQNTSIAAIVTNLKQTVKELEKIKKEERHESQNQDQLQRTDEIVKNDTSVKEIWKNIPSKFISSDETCVPKCSNNDFTVKPFVPGDSEEILKSYSSTKDSFIQTSYNDYNRKPDRYSCKEIFKNNKEFPTSTEKSKISTKFIYSDETHNEQKGNEDVYSADKSNSVTVGGRFDSNETCIKSESNDRYGTRPPKFKKNLFQTVSSSVAPKSSSDIYNEMNTKSVATGIDGTYDKIWTDDTYDGVITESFANVFSNDKTWSVDTGKVISKSLANGTDEPIDKTWSDDTYNDSKMRSLAIGTDNSMHPLMSNLTFNDHQSYYSEKMDLYRTPIKVHNANEALKNVDSNYQFSSADNPYNLNLGDAEIQTKSLAIGTDDTTTPTFIPNDSTERNYSLYIKKLIGILIKTIDYVNKKRGVKTDRNQKRICEKSNNNQDSTKTDHFKQNVTSDSNSEHNCYLNIEQLSGALLKTIEYMSKSNRVYNSTDIEIDSDHFSNIIQSDVTKQSNSGNYIYENAIPSFLSMNNLKYDNRTDENIPSLLTNPEYQIKSNYARHLLPVLPNQSDFGSRVNDYQHPTKESSTHSEFIYSKTLNSVNDINQQIAQTEEKLNTIIDDEMEKYAQKQYFTTQKFIHQTAEQPSESRLNQQNLETSNKTRKKFTRFKTISDHILANDSTYEENVHHLHKPMSYYEEKCKCNIEMTNFDESYRSKFYMHLETFYEKLYRRAHVRAEQEKQLIEQHCFCK